MIKISKVIHKEKSSNNTHFNFCGINDIKNWKKVNSKRRKASRHESETWKTLFCLNCMILNPGKNKVRHPVPSNIYLHNRKYTISWVSYTFLKKIEKTLTWEFLKDNQNFKESYIARYINCFEDTLLLWQGDWHESNSFYIYNCLIKTI